MNIRPFLEKLPTLYTDWGRTAMQPKTDAFGEILEQAKRDWLNLWATAYG